MNLLRLSPVLPSWHLFLFGVPTCSKTESGAPGPQLTAQAWTEAEQNLDDG